MTDLSLVLPALPPGHPRVLVAALTLGAAGVLAGAAARVLLARLRRGARVRAPACELVVGAAWAVVGAAWAGAVVAPTWVPALLAVAWLGVAAATVDLVHHRLPDALTLPAVPVVLVALLPHGPAAVLRGVGGAVVAVAAHAAVHLAAPRAMGAGDVKLAAPLGAVLAAAAWPALLLGAVLAAVLTTAAALGLAATAALRHLPRPAELPHGPSMLAATWLVAAGTAVAAAG